MVDYCMCHGEDCPLAWGCYRYRAKADEYQSYFILPPYSNGTCKEYLDVSKWEIV